MTSRRLELILLFGAIFLTVVLFSALQHSANQSKTNRTNATTEFEVNSDPVSLGQKIISVDDFVARVDARERPAPIAAADQQDITAYLKEAYEYEDSSPIDVQFKDGYVVIENLDTGYERSDEERYSGPRKIGSDIWMFDTMAAKGVRRNGDTLQVKEVKLAQPQTEAFEQAVKAVFEIENIYDILSPEYLEPLFMGSSGYARDITVNSGRTSVIVDFLAWDSDAESQTLSFRADGISLDFGGYGGVAELGHISGTDVYYPSIKSGLEVLTKGRFGHFPLNEIFRNMNPFSSPYRSISIRGFTQKSPFTTTSLESFNLWVTEEKNGQFENYARVKNFRAASEHPEDSGLFSLLPVKGFGYDKFSMNYSAHARLDKVSDRWTETIELDSPELSHVKIDLDIDGYYGMRQAFKGVFERGYRSDKDEPQDFEKTAEAALENWRINNFDIYWDDRGAIWHSLNFMESQYQSGEPKTEDEILEGFDRDLGGIWFREVSAPSLLSLNDDYIRAMKSLAREDGYFAITTNPPARGTPMSGAMTLKGRADEETLVKFLKELNLEIHHISKLP